MASKIRKIFNLIITILILLATLSQAAATPTPTTTTSTTPGTLMDIVRDMVAQWYFIFRYFSIALMLVVLIYLGIKLAISSIAEDKAKYKRMLVDWVVGFVIIFTIHYYMLLILTLNESAVKLVKEVSGDLAQQFVTGEEFALGLKPSTQGLYEMVRTRAYELRFSIGTSGMIMYMVLVYYTIKFVFIYFKRFFTILILTILAPLMGLFYAFNKVMSGQAATFKKWASEYAFNVFLQTIHAIVYGIFVTLAIGLSSQSIAGFILAMVMLNFMGKAEQIMRKIFKLSGGLVDDNANKGIKENLAAATAMKASVGAVVGSNVAKDIGKGIRNAAGGVGNLAAYGVLNYMNGKVDDDGLEKAEKALEEEMKKPETERSAEKMKQLNDIISDISAKKAKVEKYRGGIKDPEKLKAKISNTIKQEAALREEKIEEEAKKARAEGKDFDKKQREQELIREREKELLKENSRKIIKRDEFKNPLTGEKERVSIGKVFKGEMTKTIWGSNAAKDEAKDLVKTTAKGIAGAIMTVASIPMIVTEPVAGLALLAKGRANSKKLFSNADYRKATNLSERRAIRAGQKVIRKRQKEEINKLKKDKTINKKDKKVLKKYVKQGGNLKYTFNRFDPKSLETIKAQMRMDAKINSIRKMNSLTLGNIALTMPFRLTGTLGAVRTIQSKAYRIQEARKDYFENLETFSTLEKKDSISKDFILDYNIKVEGIRKGIDAKSDAEIIERFGEDSGKVVKVGESKFQFGKIKAPSNSVEIKNQLIDNVLLKVAARNKILDIKDLNLKSNKIQTQLSEEFRKVGVLKETIIPEEFEIDKTLKLNIDKLEDRINVIAKDNPRAVEESIAKEVIVNYMERNNIEDANEIKKEGHKEKIKLEILEILEEKEEPQLQSELFKTERTETEHDIDFSDIIASSVDSLEKDTEVQTPVTEETKTKDFEKVLEGLGTKKKQEEPEYSKEIEIEESQDFTELMEGFEVERKQQQTDEKVEITEPSEDSRKQDFTRILEDSMTQDFASKEAKLDAVVKSQERKAIKEERLELFDNLITSLEKSEPTVIEDMLENEMIAEERKRQVEIEKDELDAQLEGFEKIINEDIDDTRAIEDYIENKTSSEVDELLAQLLALKEQDMAGIALKFKPNSYEQKRMNSIDLDRINSTYKKKI